MNYEIEMNKDDMDLLGLIIHFHTNWVLYRNHTAPASLQNKLTNIPGFTLLYPEYEKYFGEPHRTSYIRFLISST